MSADASNTPPPRTRRKVDATPVVFVVLALDAICAFVIQAWMTYGFADHVWDVPTQLCVSLIIALDLFAVTFMVLTYLLRGTGWPRGAATAVFLFAIGAQVFAAELFANFKDWSPEVRIFAAFPAAFLALAQEGVILWRTHRDRVNPKLAARRAKLTGDLARQEAENRAIARASRLADRRPPAPGSAPKTDPPGRRLTPPTPPPVSSGAGAPARPLTLGPRPEFWSDVIKRCLDADPAESAKTVARDLGIKARTAQVWVKNERVRREAGLSSPPATSRSATAYPSAGADEIHAGGTAISDAPDP